MGIEALSRVLEGRDVRFDADDSAPDYIGVNKTNNAPTSRGDWVIRKFTYSGSNVTRIQTLTGAWDDRATLGWT